MSDFLIEPSGDTAVRITRSFACHPARLRQVHLDADLAGIWLASPDMPVETCEIDPCDGGAFRYGWQMRDGTVLTLSGRFESLTDSCIIHRERFDPDWTQGEARVRTEFIGLGDARTQLQMTVTYGDPVTRDRVLASGMGAGMAAAYDRLDALL